MPFSLIYQNVRGLRTKTHSLTTAMTSFDAEVICVTESWLNGTMIDAELCHGGYQVFRRDRDYAALRTDRGGGCLALIRDDLQAVRVREFVSQARFVEDLWIKVSLPSSSLYICVVYFTPTTDHHRYLEHFRALAAAIERIEDDARVIITGDYNMSTIDWNCSDHCIEPMLGTLDDSGNALLDTMVYTGLHQFNSIRNARDGVLDLVLSNIETHGMRVSRSDHFLVQEDIYHPTLVIDVELI